MQMTKYGWIHPLTKHDRCSSRHSHNAFGFHRGKKHKLIIKYMAKILSIFLLQPWQSFIYRHFSVQKIKAFSCKLLAIWERNLVLGIVQHSALKVVRDASIYDIKVFVQNLAASFSAEVIEKW